MVDAPLIRTQYQTARNLDARIHLHQALQHQSVRLVALGL